MAVWTQERLLGCVQSLDSRARLVSAGPIRRQIKEDLDLVGPTLTVPHRFGWVISAKRFLAAGLASHLAPGVNHIFAIACPTLREMESWNEEQGQSWARGKVAHLQADLELATINVADLRTTLGEPAWEEICTVLHEERRTAIDADETTVAREFLAVWHELEVSRPGATGVWFPSVSREWLAPWQAALPTPLPVWESTSPNLAGTASIADLPEWLSLDIDQNPDDGCRAAAAQLFALSFTRGNRHAHALLADWQAALAIDSQPLERVDLFGWITTLGQVPIRQILPERGTLLAARLLKRCLHNLPRVGLPNDAERAIEAHLRHRLDSTDERLIQEVRPAVNQAMRDAGLTGSTFLERLASEKIEGELLDRLSNHGSLAISDVRDAIARGRLKLNDLAGVGEWLGGDALLRADRALANRLPGGYRRGEAYNRFLQRLSSLFFGTGWGRLLFLNLILPLAICFVGIKGLQELAHYGLLATFQKQDILRELDDTLPNPSPWWLPLDIEEATHGGRPTAADMDQIEPNLELVLGNTVWYAGGTIVAIVLIQWPALRHSCAHGFWILGVVLHRLLIDMPAGIVRWLSWLIRLPVIRPLFQFALRPIVLAWITLVFAKRQEHLHGITLQWQTQIAVFAGLFIVYISPVWRRAEEYIMDAAAWAWSNLGLAFLLALIDWILSIFRQLMDIISLWLGWLERCLMRRPGGSRITLAFMALISLVLSPIVYLLRFGFTVLLEPQVNPVKHFPVVSVGHKIMLLLVPTVTQFVSDRTGMAFDYCLVMVFTVIGLIPGFLGFMVWELKENWRLYIANMPMALNPVSFGSHGETTRGMLVPGFHSGTLPALFRRARQGRASSEEFHHVENEISRFFASELLALPLGIPSFPRMTIHHVSISNFALGATIAMNEITARLTVRWRGQWIEADWDDTDLRAALDPKQRMAWDDALSGFWKKTDIDLLAPALLAASGAKAYGALESGLWLVMPDKKRRLTYLWNNREDLLVPEEGNGPALPRADILTAEHTIAWRDWSARWQQRVNGTQGV
jgi:hypothetical protein